MEFGRNGSVARLHKLNDVDIPEFHGPVDVNVLPSLFNVEDQFRNMSCGKATGLDGFPMEVFIGVQQVMARIFHPLMPDAAVRVQQPLQRRGILYEAYKRSGSFENLESFGSLYVSSEPWKVLHITA